MAIKFKTLQDAIPNNGRQYSYAKINNVYIDGINKTVVFNVGYYYDRTKRDELPFDPITTAQFTCAFSQFPQAMLGLFYDTLRMSVGQNFSGTVDAYELAATIPAVPFTCSYTRDYELIIYSDYGDYEIILTEAPADGQEITIQKTSSHAVVTVTSVKTCPVQTITAAEIVVLKYDALAETWNRL